jgi:hypothetical protein
MLSISRPDKHGEIKMDLFQKSHCYANINKKLPIRIIIFDLIATFLLSCSCGTTVTVVKPIITATQISTKGMNAIASVHNISTLNGYTNAYLVVLLTPQLLATADEIYQVDLYEKGIYRDTATISWNQPEINVYYDKQVKFNLSQTEEDAYYNKDVSRIFTVKIHESSSNQSSKYTTQTRATSYTTTINITPRPIIGSNPITSNAPTIGTIISDTTPILSTPIINNVSKISAIQTQQITISGQGFGNQIPYNGNSKYIEVSDVTGDWNAGYSGDLGQTTNDIALNVTNWTNSQIIISGFTGKYGNFSLHVGDKMLIKVWNAQSGVGPASCSLVCGTSPNLMPAVPLITNVTDISTSQTQTITINGHGFGSLDPYIGDSPFLEVSNVTSGWNAGYNSGPGQMPNAITLSVTNWTDNQITISGFNASYIVSLHSGDQILINVWNVPSVNGPASFVVHCGV